jgi:hypothetical protein
VQKGAGREQGCSEATSNKLSTLTLPTEKKVREEGGGRREGAGGAGRVQGVQRGYHLNLPTEKKVREEGARRGRKQESGGSREERREEQGGAGREQGVE